MDNKTYIIAAGGTSGHINPAIAIADEIRKNEPGAHVIFCGTEKGIENTVVPKHNYELVHISAMGFPNKPSKKLFLAISAFIKGRKQSRDLLLKLKPDAVIGTGGYVCGPMVSMASSMGIPTLIHEQNAFPGKANRYLAKRATTVCVSFPNTQKAFSKAKRIVMTGNPVRTVFYNLSKESARQELGIKADEKILFATGGSLGARTINQTIMNLVKNHPDIDFRVILACGKQAYPLMMEEAKNYKSILDIKEYLFDQHLYLASADIVLCRAGALTCSEIAMLAKASIMVPYPYAAGDHQTFNARTFSEIGACVLVADGDLNDSFLYKQMEYFFEDKDRISKMEDLAGSLAMPDATSLIYEEIIKIIQKKRIS